MSATTQPSAQDSVSTTTDSSSGSSSESTTLSGEGEPAM